MEFGNQELYNRIDILCAQNGISMTQLEKQVKSGDGALTSCDTIAVSWDLLAKVAQYFNVSMDYLAGRTNNPKMNGTALPYGFDRILMGLKGIELNDNSINFLIKITKEYVIFKNNQKNAY